MEGLAGELINTRKRYRSVFQPILLQEGCDLAQLDKELKALDPGKGVKEPSQQLSNAEQAKNVKSSGAATTLPTCTTAHPPPAACAVPDALADCRTAARPRT